MHGHRQRTPEAEHGRRWFMNKALLAGGVAAMATMTGCSSGSSDSTSTASAAPSAIPSGGPGGGGGPGPGATQVKYDDVKGVTTDGNVVEDLFSVHSTGVSTDALVKAAQAFLDGLSTKERRSCTFDVDADEWTAWSNVDGYERKGVRVGDLTTEQRDLGYALLDAALSAEGLKQTRGIMKLNGLLGESRGGGQETLTEGHHVAINYFVLGDQVVMTPTLWGRSRPRPPTRARRSPCSARRRRPAWPWCAP
ncbi:DUF3500 domain-containing protein [Streptomyces sp. NPDC056462]|uniref:DUF3500 domain-containing protein n=1 Tax=Streptomyces sp. NPDC056462 TaxID=3345826 RepID=UPI0036ABBF79